MQVIAVLWGSGDRIASAQSGGRESCGAGAQARPRRPNGTEMETFAIGAWPPFR